MKIFLPATLFVFTSLSSLFTGNNTVLAQEPANGNFDEKSKLHYQIESDDETLHINLKTTDRATIMRIVRNGLTVYMDANGKKNKQVFLQYPMPSPRPTGMAGERSKDGQRPKFSLNDVLDGVNTMALYSSWGVENKFFAVMPTMDIAVAIMAVEDSILVYDLYIPFGLVKEGGRNAISKLSVGIVPGKFEMPQGNAGAGNAGGRPAGGGRQGPRIGSPMATSMPMDAVDREADISFWIPVELSAQK